MKKGTGRFLKVEEKITVCDFCEKPEITISLDYRWNDGYDSYGDEIEACSLDCLMKELGKHDPNYVFHMGAGMIHFYAPPNVIRELLEDSFGTIIGT